LNGVIALILRYFTEFDSCKADDVTVVEDTMSSKCHIQVTFGQNQQMQQSHGLFATSKLLVCILVSFG